MGASGRVARDPSECAGAPSRLSATRCRAPSRDSPSRPARGPSARQRRRDAAPPTAPRPLLQARLRDRFWAHAGQIEAQSGAARQARGQEAQGAPSRRGAGARDQALPLRLAGASRRRRAAALGARPRALRAPHPTSTRACAHSRPPSSCTTCTKCPRSSPSSHCPTNALAFTLCS